MRRIVFLVALVLALGAFAPPASAEILPTLDGAMLRSIERTEIPPSLTGGEGLFVRIGNLADVGAIMSGIIGEMRGVERFALSLSPRMAILVCYRGPNRKPMVFSLRFCSERNRWEMCEVWNLRPAQVLSIINNRQWHLVAPGTGI